MTGPPQGACPGVAPAGRITMSTSAFVAACGTFLLIGALAALYGPLFDEFTRRYDVGVSTVGFVVSAHFAGALAGVVAAMAVIERVDGHVAIRGALGLLALVPLTARVREPVIVVASTCAAIVTLLLALVPGAAVAGYVLTGVALAPVFPTGLAWLARLDPGNPRTTSWLLAVTMLGGVLFPPAVGVVIARFGAAWAPAVLAVLAGGSLAAFATATRRRPPAT